MESGYPEECARAEVEKGEEEEEEGVAAAAGNWPPFPSHGPWKNGEMSQLHYTPNRQQQGQSLQQHPLHQELHTSASSSYQQQDLRNHQQQNVSSHTHQHPTNYSTLYGAIDSSRRIRDSPLPLQSNTNNDHLYRRNESTSQNSTWSVPHSYGQGEYTSSIPGGQDTHPSSSSGSITPSCYCSFLGQPCICSKSSRSRFPPTSQSYSTSSSSSTDMEGVGLLDSVTSPISPLNQVVHYPMFQKVLPPNPSTLQPVPLSGTTWSQDPEGVHVTSFDDLSNTSTPFHPSRIQQPTEDGGIIRLSPTTYIPSDEHHTVSQHPSKPNQLYESISSDTTIARPFKYDPSAGPSNVSTYHTPSLLATNMTDPESISVPLVQVNPTNEFRSGYRSVDSSLPHWSLRQTSIGGSNNPITNDSVAQMSQAFQHSKSFSNSSVAVPKQSTSGFHDVPGFSHHTNSRNSSTQFSMNSSSSTSSSLAAATASTLDGNEYRNRLGTTLDRFTTEAERWEAITNRVHSADIYFVYGSLTTRIYCRPSCASKRPDRNRVVYFPFPDAPIKAEYAGYRACKRCKPRTPGTADACVLAVGQCLRHITQAALLGESEEVEARFKKRTLKEYSTEYGVSAFHFHRTLKNVSTLTPGDYSKACYALVLQDEIGMDKKLGQPLTPNELQHRLRGWSSRRARRAVGNILPSTYAHGFQGMKMFYIYASDTSFGNVAILYTKGAEPSSSSIVDNSAGTSGGVVASASVSSSSSSSQVTMDNSASNHCTIMGAIIGEDALTRVKWRSSTAVEVVEQSDWLKRLVEDLARKGLREVQLPPEVIPWIRRARVWLAVKKALEPKSRAPGKRRVDSDGEEEDDYEGEDEEADLVVVKGGSLN